MNIFKKKNLVGLDIGTYGVKVVELLPMSKKNREGFQLAGIGYEPLPPQSIVEGSIMDFTAVAETVSKALDGAHIKNRNVAISLSGTSVITRKFMLQNLKGEDLEESIKFEAKGQLTSPIEDVFFDYEILREEDDKMDVLLVAIKKEKVNEFISAVVQSGRNVEVVDTDHFALLNAVEYNYALPAESTHAIINMGAYQTNIIISKNGVPLLTRDISFGGNNFTEVIQKEFHLDYEKAEMVKKGQTVGGVNSNLIEHSVKMLFGDLKLEIAKTFDYFQATSTEEAISKIFLAGGGSRVRGLNEFLGKELNLNVESINPFQNVLYNERKFDTDYLHEMEAVFGVAMGLAMRRMGE